MRECDRDTAARRWSVLALGAKVGDALSIGRIGMKASIAWIAIGVTIMGCSSSSGGSGSSASCGSVAACGGDIVGTWKIVAACADVSAGDAGANPACPNETVSAGPITASGTVTFNADKTYSVSFTESVSEKLFVPASCLSANGVTLSCSDLGTEFNGTSVDDAGTTTVACTASGTDCNCTFDVSEQNTSEMGTYTLSGNTFTTTASGSGTPGTASYCVQGNTLHVISMDMGSTMGMPTSDLVATK
jgi:hypothetical protein